MAKVSVSCPKCQARYSVEEAALGKKTRCKKPDCGTAFVLKRPGERVRGDDGIPQTWEPGDVILDLYEIKKVLGAGGMGQVHLARHRGWNLDLAVKSVLPEKVPSPKAVENFQREAEVWIDKLGLHPHVVSCFYVRVLGGLPRVFIEYIDGGSLKDWIADGRLYEGGPQRALERILDIAVQFAWGLHYAHEQGLIHQDVKPANAMMTADGVAKVTDFGLANARAELGEPSAGAGRTLLATWGGMTQAYCSPEQADIQAKHQAGVARDQWPKLTRRTDIWSWAVSVLEMFTGEITWPTGSVAGHFLKREVKDGRIPQMSPAVIELLGRCLQRRPEDRPQTMLEVADALQDIYRKLMGRTHPHEKPKPNELLADSFNNRAVSLIDLKKPEAAEQKWQDALRVDPHHPEATYNRGLIQWRSVRTTDQKLLEKLREVYASSGNSARTDYLMGLVHLERADAHAAVRLLSKALEVGGHGAEIASALVRAQSMIDTAEQFPPIFEGGAGSLTSLSWSPDGRFALSGGCGLRLWEVSSGKCLHTFEDHPWMVTAVSWSPDGRCVLSGRHHELRLWDVSTRQCLRIFEGHTGQVDTVSWSPDGNRALSGGQDSTLRLWEVSSGRCLRTIKDSKSVTSAAWSPDGCYALSGSKTLRLWEPSSGRCLRTFKGHAIGVNSVAWSPDGRFALSGGRDHTLRLWEASSGQCLRIFEGHSKWVSSVSWSPDGRFALSGSWDKTVRLWEAASGQCLRTFEGHTGFVTSVAWSPDGRCALSGSEDGTLRLWGIAFAKQIVPFVISTAVPVSSGPYHHLLQQVRDALARNPAGAAGLLRQAK